ncbi:Tripartite motif-containing protein 3 [Balamuthia mandrillaris]
MEVKQVARPQVNDVVAIDVVVLSEEEEATENEKEKEKETDVLKITGTEEPSSRPEWTKLLECPICLSTCQDPAMLDVCYHTFCFLCILQWVELSPKCPLCKRGFDTILHDLRQEEGAPMEYKRFKPSPSPSSAAARSSMEARRRSRRQRVTPKRSLGDEEERERQRKQRKRVYYQQQLQQKPSRDRKRAHVEVIDLCDDSPVKSSSPPPSSSSSSSSIRDASTPLLKAWVHRELEALLETEDLDLLLLVVRSLLERTCSSSSSSSSSTRRGASLTVGQVLELRPHMEEFLFEHTQQFLHELALYWKSSDGGNKGWNDGGRSCSNSSIILE